MKRLLIRECYSPANDTTMFGILGAHYGDTRNGRLTAEGEKQARKIRRDLEANYPDYDLSEPVATSTAAYCKETAEKAGLKAVPRSILDNPLAAPDKIKEINRSVGERTFTPDQIEYFRQLLDNPPPERIWIMSGYVEAGVCSMLGLYGKLIPRIPSYGEDSTVDLTVDMTGDLTNFMPYNGEIREAYVPVIGE